jgi:hypothetical protein
VQSWETLEWNSGACNTPQCRKDEYKNDNIKVQHRIPDTAESDYIIFVFFG